MTAVRLHHPGLPEIVAEVLIGEDGVYAGIDAAGRRLLLLRDLDEWAVLGSQPIQIGLGSGPVEPVPPCFELRGDLLALVNSTLEQAIDQEVATA